MPELINKLAVEWNLKCFPVTYIHTVNVLFVILRQKMKTSD